MNEPKPHQRYIDISDEITAAIGPWTRARGRVFEDSTAPAAGTAPATGVALFGAVVGAATVRAVADHEHRYLALRDEGLDDAAARAELADFTAYAQSTPWSYDVAWRDWQTWRARKRLAALTPFTRARPSFFGHAFDAAMGRAGIWPTAPCACHPLPFPAARDYRRRTKHRRRRQR